MSETRALTAALGGRWHGRYGTARCPAHDDRTPSLSIGEREGKLLVHCHSGCQQRDVIAVLVERCLWGSSQDTAKILPWQPPTAKPKPHPAIY